MKKGIYVAVIVAVAALVIISLSLEPKPQRTASYHVTLADPKLYSNGIFTDSFKIQKGSYQFGFVPNGDSPKTLTISLKGSSFSFSQDFKLEETPHTTGISTYYTWDYLGTKNIQVIGDQELKIIIDPHGETLGSISVDLVKK